VIRRSLTLMLGAFLTVGAFLGFLPCGRVTNPPAHRVAMTIENIRSFNESGEEMFAPDKGIIGLAVALRHTVGYLPSPAPCREEQRSCPATRRE